MKVCKIPQSLASAYHGSGYALVAILNNQVVALRYVEDVAPSIADAIFEADGAHAQFFIKQWLSTNEARNVIRELQVLGEVSVGMVSAWEFVEL